MLKKFFKKLFKRGHPYAPVNVIGRKNVERILGADIVKNKKLEKEANANAEHEDKHDDKKATAKKSGAKKGKKNDSKKAD